MALTTGTTIRGLSTGTVAEALVYAKDGKPKREVDRYVRELHRICVAIGIRFEIAFAQWCDETAIGTSEIWKKRLNPGGIGVTDDHDQMISFDNGDLAARAHLIHLWYYVDGETLPPELAPFAHLDPRLEAVRSAGFLGKAQTLAFLSGRWATNPNYANQIVGQANRAFGNLSDTDGGSPPSRRVGRAQAQPKVFDLKNDADALRFGVSTTKPSRNDDKMRSARDYMLSRCIIDRKRSGIQGAPRFIVLHIQDGTTTGSLDHWINGRTAGKRVGASSTVMIQKDGSILRVIPEGHGPWTNGNVAGSAPQAQPLIDRGGSPNQWSLTIEAEGKPFETRPPAQIDAIVWQCRDWMARFDIPIENILKHAWIKNTKPNCPGPYFDVVLARLRDGAPVHAVPVAMSFGERRPISGKVKDRIINDHLFLAYQKKVAAVRDGVPVLVFADPATPPVQAPLAKGQKVDVDYVTVGSDGKLWFVTADGGRTPVEGFVRR